MTSTITPRIDLKTLLENSTTGFDALQRLKELKLPTRLSAIDFEDASKYWSAHAESLVKAHSREDYTPLFDRESQSHADIVRALSLTEMCDRIDWHMRTSGRSYTSLEEPNQEKFDRTVKQKFSELVSDVYYLTEPAKLLHTPCAPWGNSDDDQEHWEKHDTRWNSAKQENTCQIGKYTLGQFNDQRREVCRLLDQDWDSVNQCMAGQVNSINTFFAYRTQEEAFDCGYF